VGGETKREGRRGEGRVRGSAGGNGDGMIEGSDEVTMSGGCWCS
jgi:hypothetical protein